MEDGPNFYAVPILATVGETAVLRLKIITMIFANFPDPLARNLQATSVACRKFNVHKQVDQQIVI
jgi:hypothetical protein